MRPRDNASDYGAASERGVCCSRAFEVQQTSGKLALPDTEPWVKGTRADDRITWKLL
jgi:hypothetical protein